MLGDVFYVLDLKLPRTGWIGVDRSLFDMTQWGGLTSLLLWIPVGTLALLVAVLLSAIWLAKAAR